MTEAGVESEKHKLQGELKDIPLELLIKSEWNPNEMKAAEFDGLTNELNDDGVLDPAQVVPLDDGTYKIMGGHHRIDAAKVLGWPTFPCLVVTAQKFKEEDLQKFVNMRLNIIKGKISPEKFVKLYDGLSQRYDREALQQLMGFVDQDAFSALLGDLKKDIKDSDLPDKIKEKFAETANELKSIDDVSNILHFLFNKYGNTLDCGFMVLVYGGHDHVYVPLKDKALKKQVDRIQDFCLEKKVQIEGFFKRFLTDDAISKAGEELVKLSLEEAQQVEKPVVQLPPAGEAEAHPPVGPA